MCRAFRARPGDNEVDARDQRIISKDHVRPCPRRQNGASPIDFLVLNAADVERFHLGIHTFVWAWEEKVLLG